MAIVSKGTSRITYFKNTDGKLASKTGTNIFVVAPLNKSFAFGIEMIQNSQTPYFLKTAPATEVTDSDKIDFTIPEGLKLIDFGVSSPKTASNEAMKVTAWFEKKPAPQPNNNDPEAVYTIQVLKIVPKAARVLECTLGKDNVPATGKTVTATMTFLDGKTEAIKVAVFDKSGKKPAGGGGGDDGTGNSGGGWIIWLIVTLVIAGASVFGYFKYKAYMEEKANVESEGGDFTSMSINDQEAKTGYDYNN